RTEAVEGLREGGSKKAEAGSRKSEARSRKPEAGSRKPEARSQKPEARSQKPEARSQKPEARSQKPEARSCYSYRKLETRIGESPFWLLASLASGFFFRTIPSNAIRPFPLHHARVCAGLCPGQSRGGLGKPHDSPRRLAGPSFRSGTWRLYRHPAERRRAISRGRVGRVSHHAARISMPGASVRLRSEFCGDPNLGGTR